MRLINVDMLGVVGVHVPGGYDAESYAAGQMDMLGRIVALPTVDAVEVTRCEQCKFCRKTQIWLCNRAFSTFQVKPESFCSFAIPAKEE